MMRNLITSKLSIDSLKYLNAAYFCLDGIYLACLHMLRNYNSLMAFSCGILLRFVSVDEKQIVSQECRESNHK